MKTSQITNRNSDVETKRFNTITESIMIPHRAFKEAGALLAQCFEYADAKTEAEGLAIVGEAGTGKTTVVRRLLEDHPPIRAPEGMVVPILFATVPSAPTVKSLASALLEGLGAPDPDRGTENERSRRLRVLMRETETRMVDAG